MPVSSGFFEAYGISVVRGRAFADIDAPGSERVAMVNETFARRAFPDMDALGETLLIPEVVPGADSPGKSLPCRIVGVFADVQQGGPRGKHFPEVYTPFRQTPWPSVAMAIRSTGDPSQLERSVSAVIHAEDPELPLSDLKTLDERVREFQAGDRFGAALFLAFAVVALLLAAFGIYGVMAFSVVQRTHEIGIRVALGARGSTVQKLVIGQGLRLAAIGIAVGLPIAFGLSRLMGGLLFGVTPTDPLSFLAIGGILVLVAVFACWIPARRAARVDPMIALRAD